MSIYPDGAPVWVNGRLVDAWQAVVSVFDHGLLVGDGVFETVKTVGGRPFALTRHLERLRTSARRMGLADPDLAQIRDGVRTCLDAASPWELGRIRITHTSGVGPLGSARGDEGTTTIVIVAPQPPLPPVGDVVIAPWARNERGALAGVKSTSYGENAIALAYAKEHGAGEAVLANLKGEVCEGTGSNVFVVRQGRLFTPPLTSGCLAGVTRDLVLEWCGGEEADLPIEALREAEEAFLTSTTRDIQPIRRVDGRELPACPGPVTAKAMRVFAERSTADVDP
ncbi:aminotransferase class IV [Rhizohabitans arisaemae]|uniref:aminotransferase class IV n=1 Tax=Rhizohabitans arisaemae TaxID=2720610 RepID=UPI0024B2281D|nr:aminotransferase class IV [Rhizohabitans arisaemae]